MCNWQKYDVLIGWFWSLNYLLPSRDRFKKDLYDFLIVLLTISSDENDFSMCPLYSLN